MERIIGGFKSIIDLSLYPECLLKIQEATQSCNSYWLHDVTLTMVMHGLTCRKHGYQEVAFIEGFHCIYSCLGNYVSGIKPNWSQQGKYFSQLCI